MFFLELTTSTPIPPAHDPTGGLIGSPAWFGTGLLGAVLGWLLFIHLPGKDKQLKELVDAKDKQIRDIVEGCDKLNASLVDKFDSALKDARAESAIARAEFRESLEKVNEKHERQYIQMLESLRSEFAAVYDRAMIFATRHNLSETSNPSAVKPVSGP